LLFSLQDNSASQCKEFNHNVTDRVTDETVKEVTGCSILQNHISLGITKANSIPNGDVQNIKYAFNTTSISEMLNALA